VQSANRSFYRTFRVLPQETEGQLLYDLGNGQWDIPRLRTLLEEILPQEPSFDDYEVEHDFPDIGRKVMLLNARRLRQDGERADPAGHRGRHRAAAGRGGAPRDRDPLHLPGEEHQGPLPSSASTPRAG
jgi:hypothetical protein